MNQNTKLINKLYESSDLTREEYIYLLEHRNEEDTKHLFGLAVKRREEYYGKDVYIRGLIEFTNYCKNDCYYCGIRKSNLKSSRYRLEKDDILKCCENGYELGFRTFVLQGGEDLYYDDKKICDTVYSIKEKFPDCAVTLSIGEKSKESYKAYFDSGADRYLLRHETADPSHYAKLHPKSLSCENRKRCLWDLKNIGYQVGTGFMVESPYQTAFSLAEDMLFIKELRPAMVGIGPFITHKDTPFANEPSGTLELTLFMLSLIRLTLPYALIPATTALGTVAPNGRERGILVGANVVMPNLSPVGVRKKYALYDNKICTGEEAAECRHCLERRIESVGYKIKISRGDVILKRG